MNNNLFIYMIMLLTIYNLTSIHVYYFSSYVTVKLCTIVSLFALFQIVSHDLSKTESPLWGGVEVACCYTSIGHALLPKVVHFRAFVIH